MNIFPKHFWGLMYQKYRKFALYKWKNSSLYSIAVFIKEARKNWLENYLRIKKKLDPASRDDDLDDFSIPNG